MLNWLKFHYFTMAIIFLAVCAMGTAQQQPAYGYDSQQELSHAVTETQYASEDCDSKAQQFTSLKHECIMSGDPACLAKLERLASGMQLDLDTILKYYQIITYNASVNWNPAPFASMCATHCGEQACRAALETADTYSTIGDDENAKKVYRNVITSFTGTAYTGFVKKAEFALEDLKDKKYMKPYSDNLSHPEPQRQHDSYSTSNQSKSAVWSKEYCKDECNRMLKNGELKKGMTIDQCVKAMCK